MVGQLGTATCVLSLTLVIGMKTFGASAPLKELQRKFGFEPERVVEVVKELMDFRGKEIA